MNDLGKNLSKVVAVTQEVEASFRFIETGLLNLRSTKFIGANNHVTLQLLAAGFERLLKILLLLKHKHLHGEFPEQVKAHRYFSKYRNGHGIEELLKELLTYADEVPLMNSVPMVADDLAYLKNDPAFHSLLDILTEFAVAQRYFYIDTIVLDNFNPAVNPFELFSDFIYDFNQGVDTSGLSYEQEDQRAIKAAIICIEKGVRAISRFFTHGLDSLGRQYYGDFSSFILLKEEDLGSLKYTEPSVSAADSYLPIPKLSLAYLKLVTTARSQIICASDHPDWPFTVSTIKVYFAKPMFYFAEIGNAVFALTGATSSHYQVPTYFKSPHLKPKGYALFLLETAQKLS
ncbi:hypothetical protein HH214_06115 [Mucilaginibacter robiniae]|uniref:HEPN domain-containing protein n=1 Tax=Mucilaginibacter robiniae TaxID=2728022 RepID=A0A7L5DZM2_9SPHI|nr:hypothetical protein [Mucilaginibacter robiniae]QJD95479.1 hypothetical protein HH214_06115 [Mucilaginibacter robiniae]